MKDFSNINTEERPEFDPNCHIKAPCWHRTIPALNAGGRSIRDLISFPTTRQARGQPGMNEMHNNKKIHVAKKYLRKGSTSLVIKEIQVKMMCRIHPIWSTVKRRWILMYCWKCKSGQTLCKSIKSLLQKLDYAWFNCPSPENVPEGL